MTTPPSLRRVRACRCHAAALWRCRLTCARRAADETPQARVATGTVLAGEDDEEDSTSEDDDTVATASTAANVGAGVDQDIDGAAPNRQGLDLMTAALKSKLGPVLTMLSARLVELQQRQVVRAHRGRAAAGHCLGAPVV